ncbi:MAG TPA: AraC family transcriptional regulator [Pedobacter sp.]|jgi:AraC-like DNA-binding protein
MKPVLEHLPKNTEESFVAILFDYNYYPNPWHFHPEYELVLVTESTGKRFIGEKISTFEPGDLAFIGPNLPHFYRNDSEYYEGKELRAKSIVVHFLESSFGEKFLSLPETKAIQALFLKSKRGLDITGETNKIVSAKLHELLELKDFDRWLKLLEILNILAHSNDCSLISSTDMTGINDKESDRMNRVLNYVMKNFQNQVSLTEAANIANMSENAFSRYFSLRSRKTFISFVNEVRLSHACKLLIENKANIVEICFQCGFNNLSNFNKHFKKMYNVNPSAYQKQYLKDQIS